MKLNHFLNHFFLIYKAIIIDTIQKLFRKVKLNYIGIKRESIYRILSFVPSHDFTRTPTDCHSM